MPGMQTTITKTTRQYLTRLAQLGGEVKGPSKRRGDSAHYRELAKLSAEARRAKGAG